MLILRRVLSKVLPPRILIELWKIRLFQVKPLANLVSRVINFIGKQIWKGTRRQMLASASKFFTEDKRVCVAQGERQQNDLECMVTTSRDGAVGLKRRGEGE